MDKRSDLDIVIGVFLLFIFSFGAAGWLGLLWRVFEQVAGI